MVNLLGTRIGHYRIVDLLGEGGMGQVYVGYDETLDRKVAIKSIRADHRLNAEAKARFLREARVLSQLAHPNICQIYDYLEGDAADVLVLELIRGQRLSEAMRKGLDDRQKLRIAGEIAGVLVAAHEKGIVHRDLKPENVMLSEEGQVKVLDFGLSRAQEDDATIVLAPEPAETSPPAWPPDSEIEKTLAIGEGKPTPPPSGDRSSSSRSLTRLGTVIGTPGYMSPEQARGETVATASDLYSFGLILQELFTGKSSHESGLNALALLEKAKKGETLPVTGVDPDLAVLIERLESPAPAARPTALDVAEKLDWIRRKPQRRRRRWLMAAAMAVLALFGTAMTVQSFRAMRAEKRARAEAETAKRVSGFLVDLFKVSDPSEARGKSITAREILDAGAAKIGTELKEQPLVRARLLNTMGAVYTGLGLYKDAEPLLSSALAAREGALGPGHPDVAESLHDLAFLYWLEGRYPEAEPLFKRALAIREKALGPDHPDVAETLNGLAYLDFHLGRYAEAEPLAVRALSIREKALGPDDPAVATVADNLGNLYLYQGKAAEAEPLFRRALAIYEKALGPDHTDVAGVLDNLAGLDLKQGRYAEARQLYARALAINEKALGADHPTVAIDLNNLALLDAYLGRFAEAETLYTRALAIYEKALGPDHPYTAQCLNNLANVFRDEGNPAQARPLAERALAIREKAFGPDHPNIAQSLATLAMIHGCEREYAEAERLDRRVLAIQEKAAGPASREAAEGLLALASDGLNQRKFEDALERSVRCLEIGRKLFAARPEDLKVRFVVGSALLLRGRIEEAMGRGAEGQSSWKEALSILAPVARDGQRMTNQAAYAEALICLGRTEEAAPIVARLLRSGYRNPDLLALCREKGMTTGEGSGGTKP
jgi:tetratricopeptide (TPR) repeat protein